MKTGAEINNLATQILDEAKRKKDFLVNTEVLDLNEEGKLIFPFQRGVSQFQPTPLCVRQICERVGIPAAYAEKMRTQAPSLLAENVRHWFKKEPEVRMIRTLTSNGREQGIARAFLSRRYRPLDNADLVEAVVPQLVEAGCRIESAALTETRLYLQAVSQRLTAEVKKGDVVQAGVVISNSEVGCGSIRVEPMIFRLVCLNGLILPHTIRRHHIGRAGDGLFGDEAEEIFSDQTRQLDDAAFWAKVRDTVNVSLTEAGFRDGVARLAEAASAEIQKPAKAVEEIARRFTLTKGEKESVLEHLARGGDVSLWGLANAVTATANTVEDYDRAVQLERIGGEVIALPVSELN